MSEIVSSTHPLMPAEPLAALLRADARKLAENASGPSAEKAAKDFESILVYRMLAEMKRTIPDSGLLETAASKQMQDLFWYYLSQELSRQGGLGLWRELHGQLTAGTGPARTAPEAQP